MTTACCRAPHQFGFSNVQLQSVCRHPAGHVSDAGLDAKAVDSRVRRTARSDDLRVVRIEVRQQTVPLDDSGEVGRIYNKENRPKN